MGNVSHDLLEKGHEVLFAFEEAIGFMFGTTVLDKDGVSAAVVAGELAGYLYENGKTFSSLLEEIYLKYGRFVSDNSYFICDSKETISQLFERLRKDKKVPKYIYMCVCVCVYLSLSLSLSIYSSSLYMSSFIIYCLH